MANITNMFEDSCDDLSNFGSIPSSPLSWGPTPSPPPQLGFKYLTPPSSQLSSDCGSPTPDGMDDKEGQPPAKRRKISRERTTEYLDLRDDHVREEQQPQLDRLIRALHKRRKIVVVAGAGISVDAGIPDFRSATGIFNTLKAEHKLKGSGKDLFDASVYNDHESTTSFHKLVSDMSKLTKDALPTRFHHMLASLAHEDRLLRLYSQNVDGIDIGLEPLKTTVPLMKTNGKWPKTVQLHGGLEKMVCIKCHALSDLDASLFEGPIPPACQACTDIDDTRILVGKRSHGIGRLRPRMVLYSEHNPDDEAIGAVAKEDLRRRPDVVIVVGTTLKVPGVRRIVREMCGVTRDHRDGITVWINNDPPPSGPQFEDCFDLIITGTADKVAKYAGIPRWDARPKSTSPIPAHLPGLPLPSKHHFNNSYKAPTTADQNLQHPKVERSPTFSPMLSSRFIDVEANDSISISSMRGGLPTPTRSVRSTSPKLPSINDKLKAVSKSKAPKKATIKQRNPTAVKTKAKRKPALQAPATLSFKTSKSAILDSGKHIKDDLNASPRTPSKLRQIVNDGSPTRKRTPLKGSPLKPRATFPKLPPFSENALVNTK